MKKLDFTVEVTLTCRVYADSIEEAEAKVMGGQSVIPITHDIEIAFTYSQNWPLGAAMAVLLMLVVGVLVVLALRRFDLDTFLGRR